MLRGLGRCGDVAVGNCLRLDSPMAVASRAIPARARAEVGIDWPCDAPGFTAKLLG